MAKDRYGWTNRQKKLPVEHLGNIVCPNSKTISRHELEGRVVNAISPNLLSIESTTSIHYEINKELTAARKTRERDKEKLRATLQEVTSKQDVVAGQITERILNGQPQIDVLNKMPDDLQNSGMNSKLTWQGSR